MTDHIKRLVDGLFAAHQAYDNLEGDHYIFLTADELTDFANAVKEER